jgi:hypothetical protein
VRRASSITSTKVCASSSRRERITSPASLLEKMVSIREGSSCRANARLIKRPQAGALKLRKKRNQEAISVLQVMAKAGLKAYRSRI